MFSFRNLRAVAPALFALTTVLAACSGDEPKPTGEKPTISDFSADPSMVDPGQPTVLKYSVTNASTVKIDVMNGASVLPATTALTGMVNTDALNETTTFLLTATKGAEIATKSVVVTVNGTGSARIINFTATPTMVDRGTSSTLAWQTSGAVSGVLRDGNGATILDIMSADLATGGYTLENIQIAQTITLVVKGDDNVEVMRAVQIQVNGPQVVSFMATPQAINPGDTATLSWNVANATAVSITGNITGDVLMNGPVPTGSIPVTPSATETYTLVATDGLGGMAMAMATVNVNAPMGAQIVNFMASPTAINLGDRSTLTWQVANAPNGIDISDGTTVLHMAPDLMGTFDVRPLVDTTYTLHALNPLGNATATAVVTINPSAPAILSFTASPNPAAVNGTTTLAWSTFAADSLRILRGATEIYSTTMSTTMGTFIADVTTSTTFVLEAQNVYGGNTASVIVVAHNAPVINAFTVSPVSFTGASSPADLAWDVSNANHLEIFANGSPLTGFTPIDTGTTAGSLVGTFSTTVMQTTVFELVVSSGAGMANASAQISTLIVEMEPNDTSSTAIPLPGNGGPANGNIDVPGDRDWYSVVVVEGGNIRAETSDGMGGCATDTYLTLYGPDGTTIVTENDDDGFDACSLIDPTADFLAGDLPAGTYYVVVDHYDPILGTGPYTLTVTAGAPGCGNRVAETRVMTPEQCDDGNTVAGDGCDGTCQIEPLATVMGPNAMDTTVAGAITTAGQLQFIRIVMAQEGYIRAETFAPQAPSCTNTDTVIRLFDSGFTTQIGSDDEDGVGSCSLINPGVDDFAHVQVGTYWLSIEDYQNNATIPAYTVVVRLLPVGCGNGLLETGETCDDGNTMDNDGCSAVCAFEGVPENEAGGNNTFNGGGVITINASSVYTGALVPVADQDWYAVVVPQGYHLDAYVTANSFDSCAPSPAARGRVTLFGTNGTTQLATDSTSGPNGNCGRIWPYSTPTAYSMNAGTYFLRVDEVTNTRTLATYYLHVRIVAPGCGNEFLDGAEQCDDGNTVPNDGCGATCSFEVSPMIISPPGGTATLNLAAPSAFGLVQVNITQPGQSISAVAADNPGATSCNIIDTALELGDSMFQLLGTTLDGGPTGTAGNCAAINPTTATYAADLAVGTYYLAVLNEAATGSGMVDVNVTIGNPGCGNNLLETNAGEQCEDGNTTAGDGCSATCQIETQGAVTLPAAQAVVLPGAITPVGDIDIFQINVTAPVYLVAETFAPNVAAGCPSEDTVIRLFDAQFTQLGSDDEDGTGSCSLISQLDAFAVLQPGTYFLSVEDYLNDDVIAGYEIRFNSVPYVPTVPESEPNDSAATAQALGALAPATDLDVSGGITPLGDNDFFTFTLSAPTTAFFATYGSVNNLNSCNGDTELWIYNGIPTDLNATTSAAEPTIVAYDDDDGFGVCSQIEGITPAQTRINLGAGTYYLRVRRYNNAATIGSYFLRIDL